MSADERAKIRKARQIAASVLRERGQQWLATHGQVQHEGNVDITRTYVRQQIKSKFVVMQ